jgi:hypothetical protein
MNNLDLIKMAVMVYPEDNEAARHAERQLRHTPDFSDIAEELIDMAIMDAAIVGQEDPSRLVCRAIRRTIAENTQDAGVAAAEAKRIMRGLPWFDETLRDRFISQGILVLVEVERALLLDKVAMAATLVGT